MTEIDKKNLKNYLCFTFGITYIAWGILAIFTQSHSSLCPSVWNKLYKKYSHDELASLGSDQSMGVCHDVENSSTINYMAGYIVNDVDKATSMGLDVF